MGNTRTSHSSDLVFADADFFKMQQESLLNICNRCNENGTDFAVCWYCMTDAEKVIGFVE